MHRDVVETRSISSVPGLVAARPIWLVKCVALFASFFLDIACGSSHNYGCMVVYQFVTSRCCFSLVHTTDVKVFRPEWSRYQNLDVCLGGKMVCVIRLRADQQ